MTFIKRAQLARLSCRLAIRGLFLRRVTVIVVALHAVYHGTCTARQTGEEIKAALGMSKLGDAFKLLTAAKDIPKPVQPD